MSIEMVESLGDLIKKEIKRRGLKASFIAEKMGVSRQTLNAIETRKTFDLEWLQRFKAASGIDFTDYAPKSIGRILTPYSEGVVNPSAVQEATESYGNKIEMFLSLKISGSEERKQNLMANFDTLLA